MTSELSERLADYAAVAADLGVDAVALVPGPNFSRALRHDFMSHERPFLLVIPAQGPAAALVPNLELGSWELVGFEGAVFDWRDQDGHAAAFASLVQHVDIRSLAVEGQVMRVFVHHALRAAQPDLEIVDAEREISGLRMVKTPGDIAAMRRAIEISEHALTRTLETVRLGQTEKQIERTLVQSLFAEGADDLAFTPIVAAGDGSARPHASAREDYAVAAGDALLIDFGAHKDGFCADITRTVFLGHASDEARAVYDTVLRANLAALAATRAGVTAPTPSTMPRPACWRPRPIPTASAPGPGTGLAARCTRHPTSCGATTWCCPPARSIPTNRASTGSAPSASGSRMTCW